MTVILTVGTGKTYSTIQDAVNALPSSTLTEPYVIEIYSGTYTENISHTWSGGTTAINTLTFKAATLSETVNWNGNYLLLSSTGSHLIFEDLDYIDQIESRVAGGSLTVKRCFLNTIWQPSSTAPMDYYIENCVFYGDNRYNINHFGGGSNLKVLNCTFYNYYTGTEPTAIISQASNSIEIRNNIIYCTGSLNPRIIVTFNNGQTNTYSNNIYYHPNDASPIYTHNGTPYTSFSSWETPSGDTNSSNQDPLMTDPASDDFTLQALSPAVDSGFNTGLTTDVIGTARPENSIYDIGAYEYTEGGSLESPLLCWQLTALNSNGRNYHISGPDKFPGLENISLPNHIIKNTISVIEDGKKII